MAEQHYKYWAFISYSHQDRAWADWLHKSLETYRVPRRLVGRPHWSGAVPRRLAPIFRDREELPSSAELGTVLNEALRQSRYLIVICSPQSASSRWVNEEIKYFKSLGRSAHVLPLIVGGEPNATDAPGSGLAECLPEAIRFEVGANGELSSRRAEPIAADARGGKDGRANARLKLIAGLINVGLDELKQRERQRRLWRRISTVAAAVALTTLAGLGWRWQQAEKHRALEAQALKTRITQLYESGRQELLTHNEARAAVYLNEAYKLGVDTPALRFMLARAMRVVDAQVQRVQIGSAALIVGLSPDGRRFLTVGQDWHLKIWDAASGVQLTDYALGDTVRWGTAEFSAKGTLVWAYTSDSEKENQQLTVLNADTGKVLEHFHLSRMSSDAMSPPIDSEDKFVVRLAKDFSATVSSLRGKKQMHIPGRYSAARFCDDGSAIILGEQNGQISLVSGATLRPLKKFYGLRGAVVALSSGSGCKLLAAGTSEGAVRVWDAVSGELLMTGGHSHAITDLSLSIDGKRLMSLTRSDVNIWEGRTGVLLYSSKHANPENALAIMSLDGSRLASIDNSRLALVDPVSGAELYTLDGHDGAVNRINFSANGKTLISGGLDGSAVIWKLPQAALAEMRQGAATNQGLLAQESPPQAEALFNHRGDALFVGGGDGTGEIWSSHPLTKRQRLVGHHAPIGAAAFSPNDRILATGGWDQSVCLWDTTTGKMLRRFDALGAYVTRLSFDEGSRYFSAAIQGHGSKIFMVDSAQVVAHFESDRSHAQAFSPNALLYAVAVRGVVKLWSIRDQKFLWSTPLPGNIAGDEKAGVVTFSPDGRRILATLTRRRAFILEASDGKLVRQIEDPTAAGLYVARFSANGQQVILGDFGKTAFIWKLPTNQLLKLQGHTADVRAVAFSPDDALVLSGGGDGTLKIWDAANGELLDSRSAHDGAVSWDGAYFSADGDAVLTGGTDNVARLWDVHKERRDPEQIATLLNCRVGWRASGIELTPAAPDIIGCGKF